MNGKLSAAYVIFNITIIYDGSGLASYLKQVSEFQILKNGSQSDPYQVHLRTRYSDVPLQQVMVLVPLWRHGQSNQVELARVKVAAASRHCKSLSKFYVQSGAGLIEKGQQLIPAERNSLVKWSTAWL